MKELSEVDFCSKDKGLCEIVLKTYWKHVLDLVFSNSFQDFHSNCDVPANFLRQLIAYADPGTCVC